MKLSIHFCSAVMKREERRMEERKRLTERRREAEAAALASLS